MTLALIRSTCWLLTAFEKEKAGDSTRTDIADVSRKDDTPRLPSDPIKSITEPSEKASASSEAINKPAK